MGEGTRDAFIESDADVIGNHAIGTTSLFGRVRKAFRKKRKKNRRKVSRVHRRRKKAARGSRPKFGTAAWMSYIRKFRKKGGHRKHRRRKKR